MATTKELAIKITAETSDLDKGLSHLTKSIEQIETKITTLSSKMTSAYSNYANEVTKITDKLKSNSDSKLKEQINTLNSELAKGLEATKGNAEEEYKVKKKYLEDYDKLVKKSVDDVDKIYESASKKPKKSGYQDLFKVDINEVSKDLTEVADLQRDFATKNQKLQLAMQSSFRKFRSTDTELVKEAQVEISNILNASNGKNIADAKRFYSESRKLAGTNSDLIAKINKDENETIEKLEQDHYKRLNRLSSAYIAQEKKNAELHAKFQESGRLTAGGKIFTKGGGDDGGKKGGAILSGLKDQVGDVGGGISELGGKLSGVLTKMGPIGAAAGVAAGAIAGVGAAAYASAKKYDEYQQSLNKISAASGMSAEETKKLGQELLNIPRPANMSASAVADIAATVSTFAKDSGQIKTITADITKLSAAYPDVNPSEVTAGMSRLTSQLGDSGKAFDYLASTAQLLKGKAVDPLGEATTELSTIFTKASAAISNSDVAMQRSQQMFNAFLQTGMEVGEAAGSAEAIFEDLSATLADTDKVDKFNQALAGSGKTLADVGLEAGNIDPSKLIAFMQEGGPAAATLKTELAGTGEKIGLLTSYLDKSGKSVNDFIVNTSNARRALDDLRTPMQKAEDEITQGWDNLVLNVGAASEGIVSSVMGTLASGMSAVAGWFETPTQELDRIKGQLEGLQKGLQATSSNLAAIDAVTPENATQFFSDLNNSLDEIALVSPEIADSLEDAMNSDLSLNDKLALTKELLSDASLEGQSLVQSLSLEGIDAAFAEFGDSLTALDEASTSMWTNMLDFADAVLDPILEVIDVLSTPLKMAIGGILEGLNALGIVSDETLDSFNANFNIISDGLSDLSDKMKETAAQRIFDPNLVKQDIANLQTELNSMAASGLQGTDAYNDKLREQNELRKEYIKNTKISTDLDKNLSKTLETSVQMLQATGEVTEENLRATIELSEEYQDIPEYVRESEQFQQKVNGQIKQAIQLKNTEKSSVVSVNQMLANELKAQFGITDANKATIQQKLAAIKAVKAQLQAQVKLLEAEIATAVAGLQASLAKQNAIIQEIKLTEALTEAQGKAVAESVVSTLKAVGDVASLQNKLNEVKGRIKEVDQIMAEASKGTGGKGGGGGAGAKGGGGSAKDDADDEAEKLKDAMENYRKTVEDAEEEYRDALNKLELERYADEEDRKFKEWERARAEDQLAKDRQDALLAMTAELESFNEKLNDEVENFKGANLDKLNSLVFDLLSPLDQFKLKLQESTSKNQEYLETKKKELDIEKKNLELQKSNLSFYENQAKEDKEKADYASNLNKKNRNTLASLQLEEAKLKKDIKISEASEKIPGGVASITTKRLKSELDTLQTSMAKIKESDVFKNEAAYVSAYESSISKVREIKDSITKIEEKSKAINETISKYTSETSDDVLLQFESTRKVWDINKEISELELQKVKELDPAKKAELDRSIKAKTDELNLYLSELDLSNSALKTLQESTLLNESQKSIVSDVIELRRKDTSTLDKNYKLIDKEFKLQKDLAKVKLEAQVRASRPLDKRNDPVLQSELIQQDIINTDKLKRSLESTIDLYTKVREETYASYLTASGAEKEKLNKELTDLDNKISETGEKLENIGVKAGELSVAYREQVSKEAGEAGEAYKKAFEEVSAYLSDLDIFDFEASLSQLSKAFELYKNESGETTFALAEAFKNIKEGGMDAAQGVASIGAAATSSVVTLGNIIKSFSKGKVAQGIGQVSGLVQEIGKALLGSTNPKIKLAGAIMLAAGTIGKLVAKIIDAIKGREQTATEAAEERARAQQFNLDILNAQLEAIERLNALGSASVDSEWELYLAKKNTYEVMQSINEEFAKYMSMTAEEFANEEARLKKQKAEVDKNIADAESVKELGRDDRKAFLESKGIEVKATTNTKDALDEYIESQKALGVELDSTLETLLASGDAKEHEVEMLKLQIKLEKERLDLAETLLLRSNDYSKALRNQNQQFNKTRSDMNAMFKEQLGWNIAGLSSEQVSKKIAGMSASDFKDLSEDNKALINDWVTQWESLGDAIFQDQTNLFRQRSEHADKLWDLEIKKAKLAGASAEEIAELENKKYEDKKKALTELLASYDAEIERLISISASEEEILEVQLARMDIENELLDLTEKQNGALDQQARALTKLVRERQKQLELARASGNLTEVEAYNTKIRNELKAQGKSDEEIEEFMASLPKYRKGGPTKEGPIYVHDDEFIVNPEAVSKVGLDFLNKLNRNPELIARTSLGQSPIDRSLSYDLANRATNIGSTNITLESVFNISSNSNPNEIANQIVSKQKDQIIKIVNDGIKSRNINILSGGRV